MHIETHKCRYEAWRAPKKDRYELQREKETQHCIQKKATLRLMADKDTLTTGWLRIKRTHVVFCKLFALIHPWRHKTALSLLPLLHFPFLALQSSLVFVSWLLQKALLVLLCLQELACSSMLVPVSSLPTFLWLPWQHNCCVERQNACHERTYVK